MDGYIAHQSLVTSPSHWSALSFPLLFRFVQLSWLLSFVDPINCTHSYTEPNMFRYAVLLLAGMMSVTAVPLRLSVHDIEKSCGFQKAYGLLVKVLLVYGSHALTVKGRAGSSFWDQVRASLSSLLCPGFASHRAFIDLCMAFNADGVKGCVNTESACFRVKRGEYPELQGTPAELDEDAVKRVNIRARLEQDQLLVMIPRGKHHLFEIKEHERLFEHRTQLKAVIGIIQLAFGVIQLVDTSGGLVNRYGAGCYVFTIIPYALASLINGLAAIFTPQYSEIQELHLKADDGIDAAIKTFRLHDYDSDQGMWLFYLELVTYLAIMGGMTRFHNRESTIAQRGWLISWAIVGIVVGSLLEGVGTVLRTSLSRVKVAIAGKVKDEVIKGEETKDEVIEGEVNDEAIESEVKDGLIKGTETKYEAFIGKMKDAVLKRIHKWMLLFVAIMYGVPTIGGLVVLSQQYLTNFVCSSTFSV